MKTNNKNIYDVEPVDCDMHLKYICPNKNCLGINWLTLKEAQTDGFKIVCFCGTVFHPKKILRVKIIQEPKNTTKSKQDTVSKQTIQKSKEDTDSVEKSQFFIDAIATLNNFGYSKQESVKMIRDQYLMTNEKNSAKLVKMAINFFGADND